MNFLHQCRKKWWGVPLWISVWLLPLAHDLSPTLLIDGRIIYLLYLPLALCIALLFVFDVAVLPGIILTVGYQYGRDFGLDVGCLVAGTYLFSLSICWFGYRLQALGYWRVDLCSLRMVGLRLLWLGFLLPLFFVLSCQITGAVGLLPDKIILLTVNQYKIKLLIDIQSLVLSTLVQTPVFYYIIRCCLSPRFGYVLLNKIKTQICIQSSYRSFIAWFVLLVVCIAIFQIAMKYNIHSFFNDYHLIFILPLVLYGAIRFGYHIICFIWSVLLLILFYNYQSIIDANNFTPHVVLISSMMLAFTLGLLYVSSISLRQKLLQERTQRLSLFDPTFHLPNLRALQQAVNQKTQSILCLCKQGELDVLSRHYGARLRIHLIQQLAQKIDRLLAGEGNVYHVAGYGLIVRADTNNTDKHWWLNQFMVQLHSFRLQWGDLSFQPQIGYGYVLMQGGEPLSPILCQLYRAAELSLVTGKMEDIHSSSFQRGRQTQIELLNALQYALDHGQLTLSAQPVMGMRGECYHSITVSMIDQKGVNRLSADIFPIAEMFGLQYALDLWVLKHSLHFLRDRRELQQNLRFAIRLSVRTLCHASLHQEVLILLRHYQIEGHQLLIDIDITEIQGDLPYFEHSIKGLRQLGCLIIVGHLGSMYEKLTLVPADIVKLDRLLIQRMQHTPFEHQVIIDTCRLARLRHLLVMAEGVENLEQYQILKECGVDYIQGELLGKPQCFSSLSRTPYTTLPIGSDPHCLPCVVSPNWIS